MTFQRILRLQVLAAYIAEVTFLRGKVFCLQVVFSHCLVLAKLSTYQANKAVPPSGGAASQVLFSKFVQRQTWGRGNGLEPRPPG